jgi:hypothetical protein
MANPEGEYEIALSLRGFSPHTPFHSRDLDVMLIVSDKISLWERGFMFSDFHFVTIGNRLFKGQGIFTRSCSAPEQGR